MNDEDQNFYLADTSALIALRKGSETGDRVKEATGDVQLAVSTVSVFELLDCATEKEVRQTEEILAQSTVLSLDLETAKISAGLSNYLRKSGKTVPNADLFIGATALKNKLTLVTLDSDFKRIPNLKVILVK